MTTYEHAMLGGTLALGCQRRHGWGLVGAAALAGAVPDWDGLTLIFGGLAFRQGHRVWGHNLLVVSCTGILVGVLAYWYSFSAWSSRILVRWTKVLERQPSSPPKFTWAALAEWVIICHLSGIAHLLVNIVYSSRSDMESWPLKLFWPFSDQGWVWPLVPWGHPTTSIIFVAEMFAIYRWPGRMRSLAFLTLLAVLAYIGLRWLLGGV